VEARQYSQAAQMQVEMDRLGDSSQVQATRLARIEPRTTISANMPGRQRTPAVAVPRLSLTRRS
jgi:hypothetical protein